MATFVSCKGNLLDSPADVLVNPVNCHGIMGKGLALQFKQKFPGMFSMYREDCRAGFYAPGVVLPYYISDTEGWVYNLATKDHWGNPSKIEWIASGVLELRRTLEYHQKYYGVQSVALPKLGCGLGGLNWSKVRPLAIRALEDIPDLVVYLYEL